MALKDYEQHPERRGHGWTSNNSLFAVLGMNYVPASKGVLDKGEPGFAWLENMRNYGRMNGVKDYKDKRAQGGNPCLGDSDAALSVWFSLLTNVLFLVLRTNAGKLWIVLFGRDISY